MSYTGYDKRVTLNLALHSAAAAEKPELLAVLNKLPALGWDVYKLDKEDIELVYAEFDADFEARIKDEFEADPAFLVDLKHCAGVCPLCGHIGIRWVFKIANHKGGQSVECGSECIIQHGLHVKGAETAEHARKALETAIRRAIRALQIQAWHEEYGFSEGLFETLRLALGRINKDYSGVLPYNERRSACYKLRDLQKLQRFYDRNGWLGTEKRWVEWSRLAKFARQFDEAAKTEIPFPKAWVKKGEDEAPVALVASESPAVVEEAAPAPVVIVEEPTPAPAPAKPTQLPLFNDLAKMVVFG